jgi:hypothetical protein
MAEPVDQSCGNRVLARMIRSLQDHFMRFRNPSLGLMEIIHGVLANPQRAAHAVFYFHDQRGHLSN